MESLNQSWADALLAAYATDDRISHYLLENLAEEAWAAKPPEGRSIAAIVAHMHNVRVMWLKAVKYEPLPAQLDRHTVGRGEALAALDASRQAIQAVLRASFASTGRIRNFPPDAAHFLAYLIAHDAHHRGQICMLARQLGYKLPQQVGFGMWEYNKRAQELPVTP